MPKWGLTPAQIKTKPWGLPPDALLPAKTITDPVHGDIYVTALENRVIDSAPLQRLRRVRQLGTTHLVYPGATHTRFSHSLGALRSAQDLIDAVADHRHGPYAVPDLFGEWESQPEEYQRKVAEATVLARLGALLHDMTHVPFGHSIEDDIGLLVPHDENTARFEKLWNQFDAETLELLGGALADQLRPLILSKETDSNGNKILRPAPRYPFVADIVGNTICADLLDYLPRDHQYTGLPARLGHRFIDGFYVTRSDAPYHPSRMAMQIARNGRNRADVVSELFKFLRYRYELSERALVHHAKLAADAMIGKLLEMWADVLWLTEASSAQRGVIKNDRDIGEARRNVANRAPDEVGRIDRVVREQLEDHFVTRSDDGLLEYIADSVSGSPDDRRKAAILVLVRDIQQRRLFKPAGRCSGARPQAAEIHKRFGAPEARRQLEESAARFAGLDHRWHVVLWVPSPQMRLKAAEVLVDDGKIIAALKDIDHSRLNRGREIYDSHEALWAVSAFTPAAVRANRSQRFVLLSYLAKRTGITWDDPPLIPSVAELAVKEVAAELNLPYSEFDALAQEVDAGIATYGGDDSYRGIVGRVRALVQSRRGTAAPASDNADPQSPNKRGTKKPTGSKDGELFDE